MKFAHPLTPRDSFTKLPSYYLKKKKKVNKILLYSIIENEQKKVKSHRIGSRKILNLAARFPFGILHKRANSIAFGGFETRGNKSFIGFISVSHCAIAQSCSWLT